TTEKIFTSELRQRIADTATRMLGMSGLLGPEEPLAPAEGKVQKLSRSAAPGARGRLGGARHAGCLTELGTGELIGTTALWNPSDAGDLRPTLVARPAGDGWSLHGVLSFVQNAELADVLLTTALTTGAGPERLMCFALRRPAA